MAARGGHARRREEDRAWDDGAVWEMRSGARLGAPEAGGGAGDVAGGNGAACATCALWSSLECVTHIGSDTQVRPDSGQGGTCSRGEAPPR